MANLLIPGVGSGPSDSSPRKIMPRDSTDVLGSRRRREIGGDKSKKIG